MIRTLIEVTEEKHWDHERSLKEVLDKLGFESKRSAEEIHWMRDLHEALAEKGLNASDLVEAYRNAKNAGT